jgi:hypothetical protein
VFVNVSIAWLVTPAGTINGAAVTVKVRGAATPDTAWVESISSQSASLTTSNCSVSPP